MSGMEEKRVVSRPATLLLVRIFASTKSISFSEAEELMIHEICLGLTVFTATTGSFVATSVSFKSGQMTDTLLLVGIFDSSAVGFMVAVGDCISFSEL